MFRRLSIVLALVALVAFIAACSGSGANPSGVASLASPATDPEGSATPRPSVDPEEAVLAYARCMRDHGIDMADPQVNGDGGFGISINGRPGDEAKLQAAEEACRDLMPGPIGGGPLEIPQEQRDAMLEYARCMRENGVDMPDPQFDGGKVTIRGNSGSGQASGPGPNPESEEFQAADEACSDILGDFGPDGGPSTNVVPGGGSQVKP